jgi:hypothetical protein
MHYTPIWGNVVLPHWGNLGGHWYSTTMQLIFDNLAADKLDYYEANDREIYVAFDEVLELLENSPNDPRLRRQMLRPPGAFAVRVYPGGRADPPYYLFWIPEPDDLAYIKWVGNTKTDFS